MQRSDKSVKILGIIGARSGSKGVPNKNIRLFCGKPLLGWAIEAARVSGSINRLIVCTDSEEYAEIAKSFGAEVPYLQPVDISTDTSTDLDFMTYAVKWLEEGEGYEPDILVHLYATNPFQRAEDIDATVELLLSDPEAHSSAAIVEAHQHPQKAVKITPDRKHVVSYFTGTGLDVTPKPRQGFAQAYFRKGNVMATRCSILKSMRSLSGHKVRFHLVPPEHSFDIDSEADFLFAEWLMNKKQNYGQ